MYKVLLNLLLLFTIAKCDSECPTVITHEDRRINKKNLRIVQYNVEWLYIDYYSNMDCPGNGCTWKNMTEATTHMNYVTNVIKDLTPDIINFCEIEGCDELNILKTNLNDISYQPYLIQGTDTSTGQNVGMLTRIDPVKSLYRTSMKYNYPIKGSKCGYTGSQSSTSLSKHYITEFKINNINVAFIAAHLIAYPTDSDRCSKREAQASILQTIIVGYIKNNYEVIMLGDFNDFDDKIMDINNNKPTSQVLNILKGNFGEYAGEYSLSSIAETLDQTERYSEWYDSDNNCDTTSNKDYSMIDHILVTENIKKYIDDVYIYHKYSEFCGKYNSDHYPVVLDLKYN